jgi:hypothetical protein
VTTITGRAAGRAEVRRGGIRPCRVPFSSSTREVIRSSRW